MKKLGSLVIFALMCGLCTVLYVTTAGAEEIYEEVSTQDSQYIRGLISRVSTEKMQISVRPPKGKSIRISIDPDTVLEGISQFGEFQKEQQVKVWYSMEGDTNTAIKIKKMMDLGC